MSFYKSPYEHVLLAAACGYAVVQRQLSHTVSHWAVCVCMSVHVCVLHEC